MAVSDENGALFPIFILSTIALPLVPYTILKLINAASQKPKSILCECSVCSRSGKYRQSTAKKFSNFFTCHNFTLALLWIFMGFLVYYIKNMSREIKVFEPFSILGLEPGASDSAIKKAYRRLSIQYHPDKNPDPDAHKYFVEFISKAYQALTDPISRENFEKYGHPDGRQGFQIGIALPEFLLNMNGESGGILLLSIVGVVILLPLLVGVVYLSRSSKYTGNNVKRETVLTYFKLLKPSFAPRKLMDIFIAAEEYKRIPVRRTDEEPLQKLFATVKGELFSENKNTKQEEAKFWKQHPSLVKAALLIQAHVTRETAVLSLDLQRDLKDVLQFAPSLIEEIMKLSVLSCKAQGHGWLRPATGAIELSQCIIQAVPLSARKAIGASTDGIAPFLQLPHFTDAVVEKIARKKIRSFQELKEMTTQERAELLSQIDGFSAAQVLDVERVLELMPSTTAEVTCETEGEESIQELDVITIQAWVKLKRGNGLIKALPHAPYYPFPKEESFWLLLADPKRNTVWLYQKVSFADEAAAVSAASEAIEEKMAVLGASPQEITAAVREAVEKVKNGYRLVMGKTVAPVEGAYNLNCYVLSDSWIGCDSSTSLTVKILEQKRATSAESSNVPEEITMSGDGSEEEDEIDEEDEIQSEYSEDEEEEEKQETSKKHSEKAVVTGGKGKQDKKKKGSNKASAAARGKGR